MLSRIMRMLLFFPKECAQDSFPKRWKKNPECTHAHELPIFLPIHLHMHIYKRSHRKLSTDRLSVKQHMDRIKRIWYLSPMRAAKVQASLRIRAVSPEPPLLAHTSSEWRGTFRQKARSLAPLNGWACAVKICHDGMLEDTNSLGAAHIMCPLTFVYPPVK